MMVIDLKQLIHSKQTKLEAFEKIEQGLKQLGFTVSETNDRRPWGGYLLINPEQTALFIENFFADIVLPSWLKDKYLSPKIMLWTPGEILSWQYHNRCHEYWKVVKGPVGVYLSDSDLQPSTLKYLKKDL